MADAPSATPPAVTPPAAGTTAPTSPSSLVSAPASPPAASDTPVPPVAADAPKPGDPPKAPEPPKAPDAPAAFALDKIKLPEGMKADDPSTTAFGAILADDKLSPLERGQKLLDLYADVTKKGRDAATEAWNTVNKQWADTTLADKDIGGPKWDSTKSTIAKAIDSLGPELAAGFRQALDVTGAGNHPAITKALFTFASKLTEGTHINGNPPGQRPSIKDAFYPNSPDMK